MDCGYWDPNPIRTFNYLSHSKVKCIYGINQKHNLSHMNAIYPGVDTCCEFDDLTCDKNTDAIIIVTPVCLHFEMARRGLLTGKCTFIEKQAACSSRECVEPLDITKRNGLILMVGHTFIYSTRDENERDHYQYNEGRVHSG